MGQANEEALERALTANLARAIDFVKYGDGKNAALLTFASAWLAGLGTATLSADPNRVSPMVLVLLYCAVVLFFVGATFAIAALLPLTDPREILHPRTLIQKCFSDARAPARSNLLFFGHIRFLEEEAFHESFSLRYRTRRSLIAHGYARDICSQTLINSKVAQRKFDFFNRGVVFVFAGVVIVVVAVGLATLRALFP